MEQVGESAGERCPPVVNSWSWQGKCRSIGETCGNHSGGGHYGACNPTRRDMHHISWCVVCAARGCAGHKKRASPAARPRLRVRPWRTPQAGLDSLGSRPSPLDGPVIHDHHSEVENRVELGHPHQNPPDPGSRTPCDGPPDLADPASDPGPAAPDRPKRPSSPPAQVPNPRLHRTPHRNRLPPGFGARLPLGSSRTAEEVT